MTRAIPLRTGQRQLRSARDTTTLDRICLKNRCPSPMYEGKSTFRRWKKRVEADLCEKVDVSRILIRRVEGQPSKARVSSMEAANRVLGSWADCAPESGYDQCDFQIVFEDGFQYKGHYHLNKSQKRISLARHVRKQLATLAKAANDPKFRKSDEQPVISMIGTDLAESANIALDRYNI
jgi:hypothetical protein